MNRFVVPGSTKSIIVKAVKPFPKLNLEIKPKVRFEHLEDRDGKSFAILESRKRRGYPFRLIIQIGIIRPKISRKKK